METIAKQFHDLVDAGQNTEAFDLAIEHNILVPTTVSENAMVALPVAQDVWELWEYDGYAWSHLETAEELRDV